MEERRAASASLERPPTVLTILATTANKMAMRRIVIAASFVTCVSLTTEQQKTVRIFALVANMRSEMIAIRGSLARAVFCRSVKFDIVAD